MEENLYIRFKDINQKLIDDLKSGLLPEDTWKNKPLEISEEFYSLLRLGDIQLLIYDKSAKTKPERSVKLNTFLYWLRKDGDKLLKSIFNMYYYLITQGVPYLEAMRQTFSNWLYIGYLIGKYEAEKRQQQQQQQLEKPRIDDVLDEYKKKYLDS